MTQQQTLVGAGGENAFAIKRRPLYEQAIESIAEYILANDLPTGSNLPTEAEFAEMLGVGRNTIREALKTLQAMGIIESVQKKGMVLRGFHLGALKSFLPFVITGPNDSQTDRTIARFWYETSVIPFVMEGTTARDIEALESLVLEAQDFVHKDIERFLDCDRRFHIQMTSVVRNPIVAGVGNIINEYFFLSPMPPSEYVQREEKRILKDHLDIIQAIRNRDEDALRRAITRHLEYNLQETRSEP